MFRSSGGFQVVDGGFEVDGGFKLVAAGWFSDGFLVWFWMYLVCLLDAFGLFSDGFDFGCVWFVSGWFRICFLMWLPSLLLDDGFGFVFGCLLALDGFGFLFVFSCHRILPQPSFQECFQVAIQFII